MDNKNLILIAVIGLAAAAIGMSWGDEGNGGNGDGGDDGENGEESKEIKLQVQGGGQARFVIDGNPHEWTEGTYTTEVTTGTQVDVDTEADRGYSFSRYEGTKPPYTV